RIRLVRLSGQRNRDVQPAGSGTGASLLMKPILSPGVIESLLPSLGYFGGSMLDCLEIDVGLDLTSVKLEIDSHAPTYLNLRGIEFLGDEGTIDLKECGYRLAQSSVQKNNEGRKN